jgi:hypothetical protein
MSRPISSRVGRRRGCCDAPMLVAIDGIGRFADHPKVMFWAQAWKAAHQNARAIGWLNS